jgi:GTP-binding protein HflX
LIDAANPRREQQLESVERILTELNLAHIPRLIVFNKADLVEAETLEAILRQTAQGGGHECIAITATDASSLRPMLEKAGAILARDLTRRAEHDPRKAEIDVEEGIEPLISTSR